MNLVPFIDSMVAGAIGAQIGVIGAIVGSLIGLAGAYYGVRAAYRKATGVRQRSMIFKTTAVIGAGTLGLLAFVLLVPMPYNFLAFLVWPPLLMYLIKSSNRLLAIAALEDKAARDHRHLP